jgi:4-amino-4-deoxy-L-arabinose transferase-like glycosyltransferase
MPPDGERTKTEDVVVGLAFRADSNIKKQILSKELQMSRFALRSRWILLGLLVLSAGLYIGTASRPALHDEDVDAAHAMVAQEMLQRNDFVVPYMDGIRYLIRPPMHFWMMAVSYKMLGETEFATRLQIGLAVVGIVLLTFEFGRRFSDSAPDSMGPSPSKPAWRCSFSHEV